MPTRQQRTNYQRQVVTTQTPPVQNNLTWNVTSNTADTVFLAIQGSLNGLVETGIPPFIVQPGNLTPIARTWVGPQLQVQFSAPFAVPSVIQLKAPSNLIRNAAGGVFQPGTETFNAVPPAPPPVTVTSESVAGNQISLNLSTSNPPALFNNNLQAYNLTTSEYGVPVQLATGALLLDFPTHGLTSGDSLEITALTQDLSDKAGAAFAGWSYVIP